MKVWFKRILIGFVSVVIVALVGLAIFLLTFDPNAYKGKVQEIVYNRYHRNLTIRGDIELSLFPRIGLSVNRVALSEHDSIDTFASVDSARFAVAIWPLLFNRLVVDHVAVTGFKAWVIRDKKGQFNFHNLIEGQSYEPASLPPANSTPSRTPLFPAASPDEAATGSMLPAILRGHSASSADFQIDIAGLDLKGGEIHVYDAKSGALARLEKLQVNTGRMTFGQSFDVSVTGKLVGESPVADANVEGHALVKIDRQQQIYSAQKLNVQITGLLGSLEAKAVTLRGNLAYSAYSHFLDASNLELLAQGTVRGQEPIKNFEASLVVPRLKHDRSRSEFNLEKLAFRAKGAWPKRNFDIAFDAPSLSVSPDIAKGETVSGTIKLTGDQVLGVALALNGLDGNAQDITLKELKIDGGLKQGDRLLQVNASSPAHWSFANDQGGLSAIKGGIKVEDASLPKGTIQFPLTGVLQADLVKDEIVSQINSMLDGKKLDFDIKATHLDSPRIQANLVADVVDLNNFFPSPVKAAAPAAPAKGDSAKPPAPAPKPAAPVNTAVAASTKASQPIDLSLLDSLDITGNVKIGDLKVRGLQATQFSAAVRAAKGKLEISQLSADLYQGKLTGTVTADSHNAIGTELAFAGVSLAPFLQGLTEQESRFSGIANLHVALQTQGTTVAALTAGLTGSVQGQVHNGAIKGINATQTLHEVANAVKNVFSGQVPDITNKFDMGRQTNFSSLDTSLKFVQGQGTVQKFNMAAPLLRISAGTPASIDLVNEQLDMLANVHVDKIITEPSGKELLDLQGVNVPVRISGPFNALGYQVQWKEISSRFVKQAVQEGLLDLLSNKVGTDLLPGAKGTGPGPNKSTDAVKSIGKALKGLLGK